MASVAPPSGIPASSGLAVRPFRGVRYDPALVGDLAAVLAPPYDVVDPAERARLAAAHPCNVVRVTLPEGGEQRYTAAAATLRDWQASGVLRMDPEPALYVYEIDAPEGRTRGLLGAVELRPPEAGVILPHENTMAGPVADRLALTAATDAQLEPVYLLYDGAGGATAEALARARAQAPAVQVRTEDGITHRLWLLTDPEELQRVAADLAPRRAVIADGHHRYATYLRHQADRHAAGAGPGPWDAGLALLVDASSDGPAVHPIHRVAKGLDPAEAARRAAAVARVTRLGGVAEAAPALAAAQGFAVVLAAGEGQAYLVSEVDPARVATAMETVEPDRSPAWRELDVTVLHRWLLPEVLGVPDTEETVGYQHDLAAALREAESHGGTAVLMRATPAAAVLAVARAGERMPRKSTLFTPKPRSGLVLRLLDPSAAVPAGAAGGRR